MAMSARREANNTVKTIRAKPRKEKDVAVKSPIIPIRSGQPGFTGNRYTTEDRETAYRYYHDHARSYQRTAKHLGIAASTIETWGKEDGWVERAQQEDAEMLAANRVAMAGRAMPLANDALGVLEEVMKDPKQPGMARVKAAVEVLGIAGIASVKDGAPLELPKDTTARASARDLRTLTDAQLAAAEARLERGEDLNTAAIAEIRAGAAS